MQEVPGLFLASDIKGKAIFHINVIFCIPFVLTNHWQGSIVRISYPINRQEGIVTSCSRSPSRPGDKVWGISGGAFLIAMGPFWNEGKRVTVGVIQAQLRTNIRTSDVLHRCVISSAKMITAIPVNQIMRVRTCSIY